MKKQILTLTFLTLAIVFAGMKSYAQVAKPYVTVPTALPSCITPETLSGCSANALQPVQGETYDYTVTTTAGTDIVRWFVVNNTTMEAAGDSLVSSLTGVLAAGNAAIDDGSGSDPYIYSVVSGTYESGGAAGNTTLQLQWKYFDGVTEEILLVAYVEAADGCSNNIGVFRIIPEPAFTIDVASVDEAGANPAGPSDAANSECVSPIESAVYNGSGTTPDQLLTVDYGENWVFFVVNGANYFDSWMPEFVIDYAGGTAPTAEASWAYLADATSTTATDWNTLTGSLNGGTWTSANPVIAGASAASPGAVGGGVVPAAGGECIVVRVRLDWGIDIEHDGADGTISFAANGIAYDGDNTSGTFFDDRTNFEDLHHVDCATDGFTNDAVDYIITPRPQVEEGTPTQEIKTGQGTN